jgi:uncharacterized membrane protein YfbV (UPF0208 family)
MSAAAIVTLIGVAILAGALAVYLFVIATILKKVSFRLGTVLIGVRSIAHQTEPVNQVVGEIYEDLNAIDEALAGLVAKATDPAFRARARHSTN